MTLRRKTPRKRASDAVEWQVQKITIYPQSGQLVVTAHEVDANGNVIGTAQDFHSPMVDGDGNLRYPAKLYGDVKEASYAIWQADHADTLGDCDVA